MALDAQGMLKEQVASSGQPEEECAHLGDPPSMRSPRHESARGHDPELLVHWSLGHSRHRSWQVWKQ